MMASIFAMEIDFKKLDNKKLGNKKEIEEERG